MPLCLMVTVLVQELLMEIILQVQPLVQSKQMEMELQVPSKLLVGIITFHRHLGQVFTHHLLEVSQNFIHLISIQKLMDTWSQIKPIWEDKVKIAVELKAMWLVLERWFQWDRTVSRLDLTTTEEFMKSM